jgi:hypothetical protein
VPNGESLAVVVDADDDPIKVVAPLGVPRDVAGYRRRYDERRAGTG